MNENNKIKAGEWFEKARRDYESVKLILRHGGYTDPAAVLLQQAVEKYLKGYLVARGWKLIKTHDLRFLIAEAKKCDGDFAKFYNLADKLTQYYIDEKYPPMTTEITSEEAQALCAQVEELLKIVK